MVAITPPERSANLDEACSCPVRACCPEKYSSFLSKKFPMPPCNGGKFPLSEMMETKSKAAATLMSFTSDSRLTSSIIFYYSKSA